ncbi:MAG: hypothetical protein LBQ22_00895, partial [Bacteroidales bacterium]|nr:hypothetical protein [Bacteroidales bacterium]
MKRILYRVLFISVLAILGVSIFAFNNKTIVDFFYSKPVDNTSTESVSDEASSSTGTELTHNTVSLKITTNQAFRINLGSAKLSGEAGVLPEDIDLSITGLNYSDLPELPAEFINVTGEYSGFRMLPHNTLFLRDIEIELPYDEHKIPEGFSNEDIQTYYYDENTKQWQSINYETTDTIKKLIISGVNHFTDFINAIIQMPELPETQSFTPTQMSGIQAANPLASFSFIEPPTANNSGTANLNFPISIPAGRQGMQPNLSVSYSSSGDMGLFGLGWDMQIPEITIETRWGVPQYNTEKESETYLLNGEQLLRMDDASYSSIYALTHREEWKSRNTSGTTQFCRRVEGSFEKIIRHGTTPKNYYWEIIDKQGTKYFYGKQSGQNTVNNSCVLKTVEGNIGKWKLSEIRDLNDNFVSYSYITGNSQAILHKITYTGKDNTEGKYSINFHCQPIPDVLYKKTNARLGLLEKNDFIVTGITVKYETTIIKQYRFCYEEGAFGKILLKRLLEVKPSDFGTTTNCFCESDETAVITLQEFEYYEVPSTIFSAAETISGSSSEITASAAISPADDSPASKLGGNSDIGWGTGLASTLGFGFGPKFTKLITVGGNFNFTQNFSKGIRTIIDLNGDGLPDRISRVKRNGNFKVYFEELRFNTSSNTYEFAAPVEITSLSIFSAEVSTSINFGFEAQFGATASKDIGNAWNKSKIYFSDINADGLPDIVNNGYVYYNQLVDGVPTFSVVVPGDTDTQNFAGTICMDAGMGSDGEDLNEIPIVANEIDSEILYTEGRIIVIKHCVEKESFIENHSDVEWNNLQDSIVNSGNFEILEYEEGDFCWNTYDTIPPEKEIYPPHDLVKIWIAPYGGIINISGDVILTENLMARRDATDSLKISVQIGNQLVFEEKLNTQNTSESINLQSIVSKGQHIYFRLESMDKKRFDKVYWQPQIEYVEYYGNEINIAKRELKDANGQYIYKFNSSDDFLINPEMEYHMPFNGIVKIESERIISEYLSDVVYFSIKKNNQFIYSTNAQRDIMTDQLNIDNIEVQEGDVIVLEVYCKSNVNWKAIQWNAILYYDDIEDITIEEETITIEAYDTNFTPPKPNVKFDIIPRFSTYPKPVRATTIFDPYLGGNYNYLVDTIRISSTDDINGFLSIKGSDKSVQNIPINHTGSSFSEKHPADPIIVFNDTVTYFLDLYLPEATDLSSVQIVFGPTNNHLGGYQNIGIHCQHNISDLRFGDMYQNWGQFNYKNSSGDYTDIISPDLLFLSQGLQTTMAFVQALLENNPDDTETLEDANEIMTLWFNENPYEQEKFLPMTADYKYNQWVGYGNISYVNSDTLSNTFPCVLGSMPDTEFSGDIPIGQIGDEDEVPDNLPEGAVKQAPLLKSTSLNISVNASVFGIAGGGVSGTLFKTKTDFRDMNGDRYPDEISEKEIKYSSPQGGTSAFVKSHSSHGYHAEEKQTEGHSVGFGAATTTPDQIKSFSAGKKFEKQAAAAATSISGSYSQTVSELSFVDFNGDGLPDKVTDDGKVLYNLGYSFSAPVPISNFVKEDKSDVFGLGLSANICGSSISAGYSTNESTNRTINDFIDINGDGLPDKVYENQYSLNIDFNTGRDYISLSNGVLNGITETFKTKNMTNTINTAVTFGWGTYITIALNPKGFMNWGVSRVEGMFSDINADGLPDYVYDSYGTVKVRYNQLGQTNMLKKVKNLAGSEFSISYTLSKHDGFDCPNRTMVMDSLKIFDGHIGDGIDQQSFAFEYDSCRYQRFDRENLGFKTVTTKQLDENNDVYKVITEKYHNDKVLLKGLKYTDCIADAQENKYIENNYIYGLFALTNGHYISPADQCKCDAFPAIMEQSTKYYEGQSSPQIITSKSYEYGSYGNIETYTQDGNSTTTDDDFTAEIKYFTSSINYMPGRQTQVIVKDNSNQQIRKINYTINQNNGNTTKINNYNNTIISKYDYIYDTYGNITKVTLPGNATNQQMYYQFTYDGQIHTLPTQISDAFQYSSSATYNYHFQVPLTNTDLRGYTITYEYDWRGRTTKIKAPDETDYTIKHVYSLDNPDNTALWARTLHKDDDNPGNPLVTMLFVDGLGREIQIKKDAEVYVSSLNLFIAGRVVSGKIIYDAFGRPTHKYYPIQNVIYSDSIFNPMIDNISPTIYQYDILDRPILVTYPDETTNSISYSVENSSFKTQQTDALGKIFTTYTDVRNLTIKTKNSINGITSWTYDPLGQLLSTTDPGGLTTSYVYDNLGRITQRTHPDAGTHTYYYDKAGNQTKIDKNGLIINYIYDYNHLSQIQYPANPENNVTYTYTSGRISQIQDITGWTYLQYDKFGNISQKIRKIVLPNEANSYGLTMQYQYDVWGRVKKVIYPDNEVVEYSYDKGGNLKKVQGKKYSSASSYTAYNYINSIGYDKFGKRIMISYGNSVVSECTYDNMQRLSSQTSNYQQLAYQYDAVGNITRIQNTTGIVNGLGGTFTNTYYYDDIYRLTYARNVYQITNGTQTVTTEMDYTANGRISEKRHVTSQSGSTASQSGFSNYDYYRGSNKLQQNKPIYTAGHKPPATYYEYIYAPNGNMNQITGYYERNTVPPTITITYQRFLYWDENDRLQAMKDDANSAYYLYDHAGERTWKIVGTKITATQNGVQIKYNTFNASTLYLFPEVTVTDQGYTKHIFAGTERICSKVGTGKSWSNTLSLFSLPPNQTTTIDEKRAAQRTLIQKVFANMCYPNINPPPYYSCVIRDGSNMMNINLLQNSLSSISTSTTDTENMRYFYHSDHLGSTSFVCNASGTPIQYLNYNPFGGIIQNQKA